MLHQIKLVVAIITRRRGLCPLRVGALQTKDDGNGSSDEQAGWKGKIVTDQD